MWLEFEKLGKARPRSPCLIVAVSTSLPQYRALYSQARELANYMLHKMEFERIGTIRSSAFPPEILVREDGLSTLPEVSLHLNKKRNVLLFSGDSSPMEDQYRFAQYLLGKAKEYGTKELYSIGARWAENPLPPDADPEPNGFATDAVGVAKLKKYGVKILPEEPAPFFASMVVAMARDYSIRGYKLSVDHGEPSPHPRTVAKLLEVLTKMVGFEIDLKELKAKMEPASPVTKGNSTIYR